MRSPLKVVSFIAFFLVILSVCGAAPDPAAEPVQVFSVPAAGILGKTGSHIFSGRDFAAGVSKAANNPGIVILDVRTPGEFAEGHIAGARNIDFYSSGFRDALSMLPRDTTYLVYCRSGNRSDKTLGILESFGFTSFAHLEGGVASWLAEKKTLVR